MLRIIAVHLQRKNKKTMMNYDASEHAILGNPVHYRFEPQILVINGVSTEFHLAFLGNFSNFAPFF